MVNCGLPICMRKSLSPNSRNNVLHRVSIATTKKPLTILTIRRSSPPTSPRLFQRNQTAHNLRGIMVRYCNNNTQNTKSHSVTALQCCANRLPSRTKRPHFNLSRRSNSLLSSTILNIQISKRSFAQINQARPQEDQLTTRLANIESALRNQNKFVRLEELSKVVDNADPEFYSSKNSHKMIKEHQQLLQLVDGWKRLEGMLTEYRDLKELLLEEKSEELEQEANRIFGLIDEESENLQFNLMMNGEQDQGGCFLELASGAGGTDSQDWAQMLFRMYIRWAERHRFVTTILEESSGNEAGLKSALMQIEGDYAYGWLKGETGIHRLIRQSPFNAKGLRHTSFASVFVSPTLVDEGQVQLDPKDLKIETFLSSGPGGQNANKTESAVRVTHIPTGITAKCQTTRSQQMNKKSALEVVQARLFKIQQAENQKELQEAKSVVKSNTFGNQVRTYTMHPYSMVKDARSQFETVQVNQVLEGDELLDDLLKSVLVQQ